MLEAWRATKGAMGMAPMFGRFYEIRNEALLAQEMGLGEYTYIYVSAFVAGENYRGTVRWRNDEEHQIDVPVRARQALIQMLRNQLEALQSDPGGIGPAPQAQIETLQAEIAALENDPDRRFWQDGLPAPLAASLAPFRAQLDATFCPETAVFDLGRNRKFMGIGIRGD
jgi:hypothetical protein